MEQTNANSTHAYQKWSAWYQKKYDRSLRMVVTGLKYPEICCDVVSCDTSDKQQKKDLYLKYKSIFDSYNTQAGKSRIGSGRNVFDFFCDTIAEWTGKDLFIHAAKKYGIAVESESPTANRKLVSCPELKVSHTIRVKGKDGTSLISLYQDIDGLLSERKYLELPTGFCDAASKHQTVLIVEDLKNNKYVLFDFGRENISFEAVKDSNGVSLAERIGIDANHKILREIKVLWAELVTVLSSGKPTTTPSLKTAETTQTPTIVPETPKTAPESVPAEIAKPTAPTPPKPAEAVTARPTPPNAQKCAKISTSDPQKCASSPKMAQKSQPAPQKVAANTPKSTPIAPKTTPVDVVDSEEDLMESTADDMIANYDLTPEQMAALGDF